MKQYLTRIFALIFIFLSGYSDSSLQTTYSLDQVLADSKSNAHISKLNELISQENVLNIKNLNSKFLPQFSFSAQATYQSETTGLDLNTPGFSIDRLSRDQYRAVLDVNQMIYDGGSIKLQKTINKRLLYLSSNTKRWKQ